LFGAEHVNVQPYSGSPANQAVYVALAKPGDRVMGMSLAGGGHLTHGAGVSVSGLHYDAVQYGVDPETGFLDYDAIGKLAEQTRPKLLWCGTTAYPRILDFERFAAIGHKVGAVVIADMAHISGLVAADVHPTPVPHVDIVTSTTHKTLRGPRGGMILCRQQFADAIDKAVFPGLQGGPHNHTTAALAVALKEAATPEFKRYAQAIVDNARVLAEELVGLGFKLASGGTDNHLLLVDVTSRGVAGYNMAKSLDAAGIVCNYNLVPGDTRPAMRPSGIRMGTASVTSRGFGTDEMRQLARWIDRVATTRADKGADRDQRVRVNREIAAEVRALCDRFPAPGLATI
jgi:glycine hydroxymethyltransferase